MRFSSGSHSTALLLPSLYQLLEPSHAEGQNTVSWWALWYKTLAWSLPQHPSCTHSEHGGGC